RDGRDVISGLGSLRHSLRLGGQSSVYAVTLREVAQALRVPQGALIREDGDRPGSDHDLVVGIGPPTDRERLALALADRLTRPGSRPAHADLRDVVGDEQLERPIERDPDPPLEAPHTEKVGAPPKGPAAETG